jgi:hypothetical protein
MVRMIPRDPCLPWLAVMATGELAERETHYPKRVEEGRMTADAAATTIRIWKALATLFSQREAATGLSWAELDHELSRTLLYLSERVEAKPGDATLLHRREAVEAMLARIRWHRRLAMGEAEAGNRKPEVGREAA